MPTPPVDGRCDQCGFDYDAVAADELVGLIGSFGVPYRAALAGASDWRLRQRPAPDVWSALEYACHVRDVFRVQAERLQRAQAEIRPALPSLGMWQWVERHRYNEQEVDQVLVELESNVAHLARATRSLSNQDWSRVLLYSYPEPTERTILWLLRHTAHEGQHHLQDVQRVLRSVG